MTLDAYITEKDKLQQIINMTRPRKTHEQLPATPADKMRWPSLKVGFAVGGVSLVVIIVAVLLLLRGKR